MNISGGVGYTDKNSSRNGGNEVKALLGAAATAHAPTPPASARDQATAPNSTATAVQAVSFRVSVGGKSNAMNAALVEGSLSISGRIRKTKC